jgi:hypothetical protein
MSSNKTISINPSLFSLGGSKTKKNREKKEKPTTVPLISPSVLKNKLLKRIKEHKQRETENLENNKRTLSVEDKPSLSERFKPNDALLNYSDEFTDSINYLQTLSKQKKNDDEKKHYELIKEKRKEEIERRSIRNYHSVDHQINQPQINMDLPEELQQQIQMSIATEPFKINSPYKGDEVPYGVLKGGLKPSYREWARTQKTNIVTNPNSSLVIQGSNITSEKTARENRLNILKEKLKYKIQENNVDPMASENLIKRPMQTQLLQQTQPIQSMQPIQSIQSQQPIQSIQPSNVQPIQEAGGTIIATKHITKKTIKRKYTLGRSKIKKTIGVLIKDRGTRKKIITAQKDLKRRNINDVKLYLRDHNLIKAGSSAPTDVLRKLYESAMLAGEISNSNVDTLLYNFSKDEINN